MDQLGIEGMEFAEIMKNISSTNGRVRLGNMLSRDNSKKIRRSNGINTKWRSQAKNGGKSKKKIN